MIKITNQLINEVSNNAKKSNRKRYNYNFHNSSNDYLQRFINAVEPDTYVRPHKHENPDKTEIFLILKGRVLIIEFDNNGRVIDNIILDSDNGEMGVEILPKTWHSLIVLKENSVLYEIKGGQYVKESDKIFAEWSPEEGTKETQIFIEKILVNLKIDSTKKGITCK